MINVQIIPAEKGRILVVKADDLMRYELRDANYTPLKWQRIPGKNNSLGSRVWAVAPGEVTVLKKSTLREYHKEVIDYARRALLSGAKDNGEPYHSPEFSRLLSLTVEGTI